LPCSPLGSTRTQCRRAAPAGFSAADVHARAVVLSARPRSGTCLTDGPKALPAGRSDSQPMRLATRWNRCRNPLQERSMTQQKDQPGGNTDQVAAKQQAIQEEQDRKDAAKGESRDSGGSDAVQTGAR